MNESVQCVLAIDVGTTGVKSIIYDLYGIPRGIGETEYPILFPKTGWVEQNAEDWWNATKKTVKTAINKAENVQPEQIVGISVTNQRETTVAVDENGHPLCPAIVWQDRRTVPQCNYIRKTVGEERIYELTGLTIDPYFSLPKILWIKEHLPSVFKKAVKFSLVHDYIIFKLSGKWYTDYSNASRTMLFDIKNYKWSSEICDTFKIPIDKLPEVVPSGTDVGTLSGTATNELGLPQLTKVVTGAGDQQAAALGVGVIEPQKVKVTTGTGTFMLAYLDKPTFEPQRRLLCSCHAISNAWVLEASIFTTGSILRWFRDTFGGAAVILAKELDTDPYNMITQQASHSPPGAKGVLVIPHFSGAGAPYWDPNAKGVIFGLTIAHQQRDIARAVLESVGYEIRVNLELMKSTLGFDLEELRITGGAGKSKLWNQIISDITDKKLIKTESSENTSLGAAVLAAVGSGLYKDIKTAVSQMIKVADLINPIEANREIYAKYFDVYKTIYQSLSQNTVYQRHSDVINL